MSSWSSLRARLYLIAFGIEEQHTSPLQTPPLPDGEWGLQLSSGRFGGDSQSEPPKRPSPAPSPQQNQPSWLPHWEADGVGGIALCLIGGGDIQTPRCCQKFTLTPPLQGQGWLQGKQPALVWANRHPFKPRPAVACVSCATMGHGDHMDLAIPAGVGFGFGLGLRARLPHRMGPGRAVSVLRRPLLRVLLGVWLEAPLSAEGDRVRAPKTSPARVVQWPCEIGVKFVRNSCEVCTKFVLNSRYNTFDWKFGLCEIRAKMACNVRTKTSVHPKSVPAPLTGM